MKDDITIIPFRQSESTDDPLTELAREGARRMLAQALVAEADAFVASFAEERLPDGRQRVVRHGFGPERHIQTDIGAIEVRRPKVRDPDEGPFIQMIQSIDFAFFITDGQKGERVFDSRYNSLVLEAIEAVYPRTEQLVGYIIHLPPK